MSRNCMTFERKKKACAITCLLGNMQGKGLKCMIACVENDLPIHTHLNPAIPQTLDCLWVHARYCGDINGVVL